MDTSKVENSAIGKVNDYVNSCPKLNAKLFSNDKTQIWDGDIFVYVNEETDKKENFFGRVPVQVKGETVTEFSEKNISCNRISRHDLQGFLRDGGGLLFLVQVRKDEKHIYYSEGRVFYCELSVSFIKKLLDKKNTVQNPTIHLNPVPKDIEKFQNDLI